MKKLTAIIPVRQGSQRVKNKNFRPFAGKSLLEHKIEVIKQLPVDNIIINTDSENAISIAKEHGIEYFKREPYYASSECTNSEYHEYLARVTEAENILVAQVTSPLIKLETFLEGIDLYFNNNCDSLMSVKEVKEFLWFKDRPVNYSLDYAPNSQDLPDYFSPTFGLILVNREAMLKSRNFICEHPYFYKVSQAESIDIDTEVDFEFAEFLFKKYNNA
jgi:CMP-N-acetylneuraminic acid synthetase